MATNSKAGKWLEKDGLLLIGGWARDGLTNKQIANNIGVANSTFRLWVSKYPELKAVVAKSKAIADIEVENALYKRAIGYKSKETKVIILEDGTKRGYEVTKEVPPDVTACIYWLKNRKPENWRDRPAATSNIEIEDDGLLKALATAVTMTADDSKFLTEEGGQ